MHVKAQRERTLRYRTRGGAHAVRPVEAPAVAAQGDAALMDEAEARLIAIVLDDEAHARRALAALDVDAVRSRDDFIVKPIAQARVKGEAA